MPTSSAILNVQLIFDTYFAWTRFGSSSTFAYSKKCKNESIKSYLKIKIKCVDAFRMLTVGYNEAYLD